jgi:hypothetical protein
MQGEATTTTPGSPVPRGPLEPREPLCPLSPQPPLTSLFPLGTPSSPYPSPPPSQAWDNIIGNTIKSVNQTGYAAVAAAGAVGVIAMFAESDRHSE